jgi:hypothetical protein
VPKLVRTLLAAVCAVGLLSQAAVQAADEKPRKEDAKKPAKDYSNSPIVKRMMAFDKNKDGKLTRDEITDPRMLRLFDLADTNKDGVVTKEELIALAAKLDAEIGEGRGRGGPRGFRDGRGGPRGGDDRGGPRGGGRFGGPPRPGQILPPFLQEQLKLTDKQKKQVEELQKEVDARLAKILTDEQKKQLKELRERFGRGGPPRDGPRDGGRPPRRPNQERQPK